MYERLEPPRAGEPESAMEPGMSAPRAPAAGLALGVSGLADTSTAAPTPPGELLQSPIVWTYDLNPASGNWRATFNGEVNITQGGAVTSFNGRTGAVTLTAADITGAGGLSANNAALTGTPTAPLASPATASTSQIATTQFVQQAIAATPTVNTFNGRLGAVVLTASDVASAGGALTASPNFTGTPTTPTATLGDASSLIASTQFVANAIGAGAVTGFNGRKGAVTLQLTDVTTAGGAPLASPAFTGTPSAPTAAPGTATVQLATTAFVTNAVTGATTGVSSFNTRTGAVTLQTADIIGAGGAPNTSPNLAGTPQAPTATAGTATAQIATTQFVSTAIANLPAGVSTFNGRSGTVTLQLADVTSVGGAPLAGPTFSGSVSAPTPVALDNSTLVATTAFVSNAVTTGTANYLPLAGGTLSGPLIIAPSSAAGLNVRPTVGDARINLQKSTNANAALIAGYNGGFAATNLRWIIHVCNPDTESGGNSGSDFEIDAYSDTGGFIASYFVMNRNNAAASFKGALAFAGVADGSNAAAGQVGEVISASIASQGLASGTNTVIAQIFLSPGDWDVTGVVQMNGSGANLTSASCWITSTTGQTGNATSGGFFYWTGPAINAITGDLSPLRVNASTAPTCNLNVNITGSGSCAGFIRARRMR